MRPVKGRIGLNVPGVYKVPCRCGACCMGQTGKTINIKVNEHYRHVRLGNAEKSALMHHFWLTGHQIQLNKTEVLFSLRLTRESLDIAITQT